MQDKINSLYLTIPTFFLLKKIGKKIDDLKNKTKSFFEKNPQKRFVSCVIAGMILSTGITGGDLGKNLKVLVEKNKIVLSSKKKLEVRKGIKDDKSAKKISDNKSSRGEKIEKSFLIFNHFSSKENNYLNLDIKNNSLLNQKINEIVQKYNKVDKNKKEIKVTLTHYTLNPKETDKDPTIGAWNNNLPKIWKKLVKNGPFSGLIAVSRDLIKKYGLNDGSVVKIDKKYYVVADVMNKRYKKRIDLLVHGNKNNHLTALKKGIRKAFVTFTGKKVNLWPYKVKPWLLSSKGGEKKKRV